MFSVMLLSCHPLLPTPLVCVNWVQQMVVSRPLGAVLEAKEMRGKMKSGKRWIIDDGSFFFLLVCFVFVWVFFFSPTGLTWPSSLAPSHSRDVLRWSLCTRKQLTVQSSVWLAYLSEGKRIRVAAYVCAWVCLCLLVCVCWQQVHSSTPTTCSRSCA